jgi:hypothetical protein
MTYYSSSILIIVLKNTLEFLINRTVMGYPSGISLFLDNRYIDNYGAVVHTQYAVINISTYAIVHTTGVKPANIRNTT